MGHKVSPLIQRIGINKNWNSVWVAKKNIFSDFLIIDMKIRDFIKERFKQASVSKIEIERVSDKVRIRIHTARPGVVIGKHGQDIERLKSDLKDIDKNHEIIIDIIEVQEPNLNAQLIAQNIAFQLEKRVGFRRTMKRAIEQARMAGCKGIKVACKGRLDGNEIARKESYKVGKIPLQTLRADIDYGFAQANTTYGYIGVKVWMYKGEIFPTASKHGVENLTHQESRTE